MWAIFTTIISWIWGGIQAVADAAIIALEWAYSFLKAGVLALWDLAGFTWDNILKPIGAWLDAAYQRLKAVYDAVVRPFLGWLQRITNIVRGVYNTFLRPILSTIDNLRRVLSILASLHVAFAQQLDDALTALEAKITGPLRIVIGIVNGLANRIESYVLTFDNLFVQVTHLDSIRRDLNPILNIQWGRMLGTLTAEQRDGPPAPADLTPVDEHVTFLQTALVNDVVGDDIDIAGAVQLLSDQLAA